MGNSPKIALRHYLQTTEAHFDEATKSDGEKVTQNTTQPMSERGRIGSQAKNRKRKNPEKRRVSRGLVCRGVDMEGLEPPTSSV